MTELPWRAVVTAVAAVVVATSAWALGVSVVQSALIASVVVALGAGHGLLPLATGVSLPDRMAGKRGGTRREVAGLSGILTGRRGVVTQMAAARLRALAARRLAHLGIDVADPGHAAAARELLGAAAYDALIAAPARPMRYNDFVRHVDALERLDDRAPAAPGSAPAPSR